MEHRKLGSTGLRVSSVGLGTMTWGRDTDELEARDQLDVFLDAGGTLVDTAASYCEGSAEEVVGALMTDHVDRRELVLVSKAGVRTWRTGARATVADASRGALLDTLDDSLARLGTDHLDLWLVQVPDPTTPLEETADALRAAVVSGRTRYVGVSNHPAWASVRAADLLSCAGPGLAAVEVEYSLVCRGIERELVPAADALGFGVLGYAPLGRGVLTGHHASGFARRVSASAVLCGAVPRGALRRRRGGSSHGRHGAGPQAGGGGPGLGPGRPGRDGRDRGRTHTLPTAGGSIERRPRPARADPSRPGRDHGDPHGIP